MNRSLKVKFSWHCSPSLFKALVKGFSGLTILLIILLIVLILTDDVSFLIPVSGCLAGWAVCLMAIGFLYKGHKSEIKIMNEIIKWLTSNGKASEEQVATGLNTNDISAIKELLQELANRGLVKISLDKEKQLYELT